MGDFFPHQGACLDLLQPRIVATRNTELTSREACAIRKPCNFGDLSYFECMVLRWFVRGTFIWLPCHVFLSCFHSSRPITSPSQTWTNVHIQEATRTNSQGGHIQRF